jgi:hypothetical protein
MVVITNETPDEASHSDTSTSNIQLHPIKIPLAPPFNTTQAETWCGWVEYDRPEGVGPCFGLSCIEGRGKGDFDGVKFAPDPAPAATNDPPTTNETPDEASHSDTSTSNIGLCWGR